MQTPAARNLITRAMKRLQALYEQPVFDEWALLAIQNGRGGVLAYEGPRAAEFRQQLPRDAAPLLVHVAGQKLAPGDFEFSPQGEGTHIDALLQVGEGCFLVCNNTTKSMPEIRADEHWLSAQTAFVELSEAFRADPLVV